jgi:hypothetical protein
MGGKVWRQFRFHSGNRKSKICTETRRSIQNRKRAGIYGVALTVAFGGAVAEAQQANIPRLGFLRPVEAEESYVEAFRQGLKELGYVEGKNIHLEYRSGKTDQLPKLAAELVSFRWLSFWQMVRAQPWLPSKQPARSRLL